MTNYETIFELSLGDVASPRERESEIESEREREIQRVEVIRQDTKDLSNQGGFENETVEFSVLVF